MWPLLLLALYGVVGPTLDYVVPRLLPTYVTTESRLNRLSRELFRPTPESVLFINGFVQHGSEDMAGQFLKATSQHRFNKKYGRHPNALYEEVGSPEALLSLMSRLAASGRQFDRIEFYGHGSPGNLVFGLDSYLSATDLQKAAQEMPRTVASEKAEVLFISCHLGTKIKDEHGGEEVGADFLRAFREAFLRNDSRVLTPNRKIFFADLFQTIFPGVLGLRWLKHSLQVHPTIREGVDSSLPPFTLLESIGDTEPSRCPETYRSVSGPS